EDTIEFAETGSNSGAVARLDVGQDLYARRGAGVAGCRGRRFRRTQRDARQRVPRFARRTLTLPLAVLGAAIVADVCDARLSHAVQLRTGSSAHVLGIMVAREVL